MAMVSNCVFVTGEGDYFDGGYWCLAAGECD